MKKYFFLFFALFTFSAFGQVVYLGGYTTTQRNSIVPGSGHPILYNTTDSEFQRWNGATWEDWGGSNTAGFPATDIGGSDKTLTQADFGKDNFTSGTPTFTVDNSIAVDSEARFGGRDADATVTLTPDTGVTFYGKGYDLITVAAVIDSTYVGHIKKMADGVYRLTGPWKSVTNLFGPNLITNGAFDSPTGWTLLNGSTITGGVATVVGNGSLDFDKPNWSLQQVDTLPADYLGKTYEVQFDARQTVGTGNLQVSHDFTIMFNQSPTGTFTTYTAQFTGVAGPQGEEILSLEV